MWQLTDYIDGTILPLKSSDTVEIAIDLLVDQKVDFLPVIEDGKILQWVGLQALLKEFLDAKLSEIEFGKLQVEMKLSNAMHFYNALQVFEIQNAAILPVFDETDSYKGLLRLKDLMHYTFQQFQPYFSVVVIEMKDFDYSLSKISHIVEYNHSKILQLHLSQKEAGLLQIHLMINTTTLQSILSSFARYNFTILYVFNQTDTDNLVVDRYQSLMKYLDL